MTLFSDAYDDVYFSKDGGLAEKRYVFLNGCNLPDAWVGKRRYCIAETGFGTGLSLLCAAKLFHDTAKPHQILDLISVELHPLDVTVVQKTLAPWRAELHPFVDKLVDNYPLPTPGFHRIWLAPNICLTLIYGDAAHSYAQVISHVDSWFLDGFTPAKNPDMWTPALFTQIARLSHANTNLASFSVSEMVRTGLTQAGFTITKRKGFANKRHCLTARFMGGNPTPTDPTPPRHVRIYGSGLAGSYTAQCLTRAGIAVSLCDPHPQQAASNVPRAILNLRLLSPQNPASGFFMAAYDYARREILSTGLSTTQTTPSLHLIGTSKYEQALRHIQQMNLDASLATELDADTTNQQAGLALNKKSLLFSKNLVCCPQDIIRFIQTQCTALSTAPITSLHPDDADIHILCTGFQTHSFAPKLQMKPVRGQVDFYPQTEQSKSINASIHFNGYITPGFGGTHMVGSSYGRDDAGTDIRQHETRQFQQLLSDHLSVPLFANTKPVASWAGVRAQTPDHMPYIGMHTHNIMTNVGHGSHGLTSALYGAEILKSQLLGLTCPVGAQTLAALGPNRFETK